MAESKINAPGNLTGQSPGQDIPSAIPNASDIKAGADMLRAGGEQVLEEAKSKILEAAEAQRQRAAEALGGMAGALHRVASDINAENQTMGRYTDMAAERLDDVAHYLRDTSWTQAVDGAEDFARRQPYWFIGGAMAAGFVLARVVKNSGAAKARPSKTSRVSRRMTTAATPGYGVSPTAGLYPATSTPVAGASTVGTGISPGIGPGGEV